MSETLTTTRHQNGWVHKYELHTDRPSFDGQTCGVHDPTGRCGAKATGHLISRSHLPDSKIDTGVMSGAHGFCGQHEQRILDIYFGGTN